MAATKKPLVRTINRLYLWACQRLYHELAWSYDAVAWLVSAGRWDQWRKVVLDFVAGPSVLEVGFGTGHLLAALAAQGHTVAGVELSPAMQRVAAARLARGSWARPPLRLRGRAQQLPFSGASFNTVVCTFPAEYILQPAALGELARVLHPGGRLVVAGLFVWFEHGPLRHMPVLYGEPSRAGIERFTSLFASAGLAVTYEDVRRGGAHVGVLVCEKQPASMPVPGPTAPAGAGVSVP